MLTASLLLMALAAALLALRIWGYFEGETFLLDAIDEWRLSRTSLEELDQANAVNANRADVVVTLTTIPSRFALIEPTIKSLLRQELAPRQIVINVPDFSVREKTAYVVPQYVLDLKTVTINPCKDLGPATKFLPVVNASASDQLILVVDDDRIYPPALVKELVAAATVNPDAAYCMSGWRAPDDLIDRPTTIWSNFWLTPPTQLRGRRLTRQEPIDVLMGYAGYIIRPRQLDIAALNDFSTAPPEAFFVDDVWISAHCRVPKFALPTRRFNYQSKLRKRHYDLSSLASINKGPGGNLRRNNTIVLRHFRRMWLSQTRSHRGTARP
jgi:glycosyltransferase involved in cell wall biosynthesis